MKGEHEARGYKNEFRYPDHKPHGDGVSMLTTHPLLKNFSYRISQQNKYAND